jgi:hypothetical protein
MDKMVVYEKFWNENTVKPLYVMVKLYFVKENKLDLQKAAELCSSRKSGLDKFLIRYYPLSLHKEENKMLTETDLKPPPRFSNNTVHPLTAFSLKLKTEYIGDSVLNTQYN